MAKKTNEEIRTEVEVDASGVVKGVNEGAKAMGKLDKSFDEAADGMNKSGKKMQEDGENVKKTFSGIGEKIGELKPVFATALAGAGVIATDLAKDVAKSQMKIQNSFGLTGSEAKKLNSNVKNVWKDGFGDSMEEVSDTLIKVKGQLKKLDGKELEEATKYAQVYSDTFDADVTESLRGVNALMTAYGMNAEEAFDYMTVGAQNGLNKTDELGDNLAEYATLFQENGYSANEMFDILQAGLDAGAYNLDKVNDLVKEFGIRIADGSVQKAVEGLGGSFNKTFKQMKKDGASNKEIFKALSKEIGKLKTEQEKAAAVSAIFGSMGEDAGTKVIEAMGNVKSSYNDVSGAAKKMTDNVQQSTFTKMKKTAREFGMALEPIAEIGLDLAEEVLPLLDKSTEALSNTWNSLSPDIQKGVGILLSLAAAGAGGKLALGGLTSILGGMMNPLNLFTKSGKGATEATEEAGEAALKSGGKFGKLGSKILGSTSSFGPWGLAIGAGALVLGGLTYELAKNMQQVGKWGTTLDSETEKTLSSFKGFSDQATGALKTFSDNTDTAAESAKTAFSGMAKEVQKSANKAISALTEEYNNLPPAVQAIMKQSYDTQAEQIKRGNKRVQDGTKAAIDIYENAAKENRDLTTNESAYVVQVQKDAMMQELQNVKMSKSQEKAVRAAMEGDITKLSKRELQNRANDLGDNLEKQKAVFDKQKKIIQDNAEAGKITSKQEQDALKALNEAYSESTSEQAQSYYEMKTQAGVAYDDIKEVLGWWGGDLDSLGLNTSETADKVSGAMSKMAQDVLTDSGVWNNLSFKTHQAIINSNSTEEIKKALKDTKLWDSFDLKTQKAILKSNSGEEVKKALSDMGIWNDLSPKIQKALLETNSSEEIQKVLSDVSTWEGMNPKLQKLLMESNTSSVLKEAIVDADAWSTLPPATRSLILDSNSTEELVKIMNDNDLWESIPWHDKFAKLDTNSQATITNALIDNKDWNSLFYVIQDATLNSNSRKTIAQVLKDKGIWDTLNPKLQKFLTDTNADATAWEAQVAANRFNGMPLNKRNFNTSTNAGGTQFALDTLGDAWDDVYNRPGQKTFNVDVYANGFNSLESNLTKFGSHANGTPNFKGGLTTLHERGDEIYQLPTGTTITPHSLSQAMAERAGVEYAKNTTNNSRSFKQAIHIENFNNNTQQDIRRLMQEFSKEAKRQNAWR